MNEKLAETTGPEFRALITKVLDQLEIWRDKLLESGVGGGLAIEYAEESISNLFAMQTLVRDWELSAGPGHGAPILGVFEK